MSVLGSIFAEDSMSLSDFRNPRAWLSDSMGGRKTASGASVTSETALTLPAYYAILHVLSEDVGKTPLRVYQKTGPRSSETRPDHEVDWVLHDEPNPSLTPQQCKELLVSWAAGWGRGVAEIERVGKGFRLWPIHPSRVTVRSIGDVLFYDIKSDGGRIDRLESSEVVDVIGWGDLNNGHSMLRYAAECIGVGLAAQSYGATFFGNSAIPGVVITHPGKLSDDAADNIRKGWMLRFGAGGNHEPAVMREGMKAERISIPPEEAQFIETRKFTIEDLCRYGRIQLSKVQYGEKALSGTIEAENIQHINDTMIPWYLRLEQEFNRKLLTEQERRDGYHTKFQIKAWLKGDTAAQTQHIREMFNIGVYSQNDAREFLDLNGIGPEGDTYYVALNMGPSEQTSQGDNASRAGKPGVDKNIRKGRIEKIKKAQTKVIAAAFDGILRKESKALARCAEKAGGDFDAFAAAIGKFYVENRESMSDALRPSASALESLLAMEYGIDSEDCRAIFAADNATERHIAESREWACGMFKAESRAEYPAQTADGCIAALINHICIGVELAYGDQNVD